MNKTFTLLIFSVSILLQEMAYANITDAPLETAILQLPGSSEANWKEIERYVNKEEGYIASVPLNQTAENWSELIYIRYIGGVQKYKNTGHSIDCVLDHIREDALVSFPKNAVTWRIIEKNQDSITYESILHSPYKNVSPQHEVTRVFLTHTGLHCIGFIRNNEQMGAEEREKWIKLLRDHSSVVSFQETANLQGLSMMEKLKDSVMLDFHFHHWSKFHNTSLENGYNSIFYISPFMIDPYVIEHLELVTMPNLKGKSLDQIFEVEKKFIWEHINNKITIDVLEQSPKEIIYSYCYPRDGLQCNSVVRAFLTDHGYYSFRYTYNCNAQIQSAEILKWKDRLKASKIALKYF